MNRLTKKEENKINALVDTVNKLPEDKRIYFFGYIDALTTYAAKPLAAEKKTK